MDILPRDKSDYIPFFMFATVVPSAIAVEFLLLLPQIFADGVLLFWYAVLGYLFTSMYFSWIKLITISTTTKGLLLPNVQKPDWKFCWICEQNSPPRSAHCYRCNICSLRFDHHCYFSGKCVGFTNYRYFMSLISLAWVLTALLLITNFDYVISQCGGLNVRTFFLIFFPNIAWLFGFSGELSFVVVMVLMASILGLLFTSYLLLYHSAYFHSGLTTYERNRRLSKYKCKSRQANIASIFGSKFPFILVLLCPYIPIQLPGDGLHFEILQFSNTKTL